VFDGAKQLWIFLAHDLVAYSGEVGT